MITVLIYGHLGMVPSEERASEVSMTWLLQSVSAQDWILSKAKQVGLSLSLLFPCFSTCISVILLLTLQQSSRSWSAVNHEWHDISIVSWWHWFYVHINALKAIKFFINNEGIGTAAMKPTLRSQSNQASNRRWSRTTFSVFGRVVLELLLSFSSIHLYCLFYTSILSSHLLFSLRN